ncbi:hypothetical protein EU545_02290 [Candidatus Thorarchaeota archaeon]|nr:MAG: hypothetical protein EU545_02290 [Candidatus Thorarchaeota archaeon]
MPFIRKIEARAYAYTTEVPERVQSALLQLFPEDVYEELELEVEETESHLGLTIVVFEVALENKKACSKTIDYLLSRLSEGDRYYLRSTLERRIDERCRIYFRFDKQAAYLESIEVAQGPDLINFQLHLIEYPRCEQEDAVAFLTERIDALEAAEDVD